MMQKKILWIAAVLLTAVTTQAQRIRLNPYGTAVFTDHVETYNSPTSYYSGKVKGGFQWGSGLEFRVHKNFGAEVLYLRQDTKAPMEYYDAGLASTKKTEFDLALNYLLVGAVVSLNPNKRIEPFAGILTGLALMRVDDPEATSTKPDHDTKFSWCIRGGVNIWVTKKTGIKLQSQVLSVSRAIGGEAYFGESANPNASTYSSIAQFGLGAGLTFKL